MRFPVPASRFYGLPLRHRSHKPWQLQSKSRENVRGAIRGAATRERLLHPSSAKAMQRRIRLRLVAAYVHRFGLDEFAAKLSTPKVTPRQRGNWLPAGYAWWRERIFGWKPQRGP